MSRNIVYYRVVCAPLVTPRPSFAPLASLFAWICRPNREECTYILASYLSSLVLASWPSCSSLEQPWERGEKWRETRLRLVVNQRSSYTRFPPWLWSFDVSNSARAFVFSCSKSLKILEPSARRSSRRGKGFREIRRNLADRSEIFENLREFRILNDPETFSCIAKNLEYLEIPSNFEKLFKSRGLP